MLKIMELEEYYYNYANSKLSQEEYIDAIANYTKAIELNPKDYRFYTNRGNAKKYLKDLNGALEDYYKALGLNPCNADIFSNIGISKYSLKDYPGALEALNKAIELTPTNADYFFIKGIVNYASKFTADALNDYNKAIDLNPCKLDYYFHRAMAMVSLGDFKNAIKDYSKVIEINPSYDNVYFFRGMSMFSLNDFKNAINDYDKDIEAHPSDVNTYFYRGRAKLELDDREGAIEDFDKSIRLNPENSLVLFYRGYARFKYDTFSGSNDISRAIRLDPSNEYFHFQYGILSMSIYKYSNAANSFTKTIELNPNNSEAYYNRGKCLLEILEKEGKERESESYIYQKNFEMYEKYKENRLIDILKDFDNVIKLNPKHFKAYHKRGGIKYRLKDFQGALEDFEKVIKINPDINISDERINRSEFYDIPIRTYQIKRNLSYKDVLRALDEFNKGNYQECLCLMELFLRKYELDDENAIEAYLVSKLKTKDIKLNLDSKNPTYIKLKSLITNYEAKLERKEEVTEEEENVYKMKQYSSMSKFAFGKYLDQEVYIVLEKDPRYILWCIVNLDHFVIENKLLINELFTSYSIYLKALEVNLIKTNLLKELHPKDFKNDKWGNSHNNWYSETNYDEDYFYAMTDGQYGDYDDFYSDGGDIDDIDTWARG